MAFVRVVANPALVFREGSVDQIFQTLRLLVGSAQRQPPCASSIWLSDSHPAVEAELQRRLAHGHRRGSVSGQGTETHLRKFQSAGVRWGSLSSDDSLASLWFPTLLPREQDALRYSLRKEPNFLMRNISQNVTRLPISSIHAETGKHVAPAQLPTQIVWISDGTSPGRLQLGREALIYQGFPIALVPTLVNSSTEALMHDLGGNMMGLPVVLAISMALFASVSWASTAACTAPASIEEETSTAVAAFERVMACKRARTG